MHACMHAGQSYSCLTMCFVACSRHHSGRLPKLMFRTDGGNVELVEIDGPVVYLRLQGACGSCPSSLTTMTMGIKRRLQEKIPVSSRHNCLITPHVSSAG